MEDIAKNLESLAKGPGRQLSTDDVRWVIQQSYQALRRKKKEEELRERMVVTGRRAPVQAPKKPRLCFEPLHLLWMSWANKAEEGGGFAVDPQLDFWDLLTTDFHFSPFGCQVLETFRDECCIFPTLERQITG